jgi:hypothetical protein
VPRQVPGDQRGDDGRGDCEVRGDNPAGPARQGDHGRDGGQVIAHDDGVGGVQGEVGSGPAHGHARMRGGQCRGVVDTVTGQQDLLAVCLELLDGGGFVLGQEARADFVDANLPGEPSRGPRVVTSEQDGGDSRDGGDAGYGRRGGRAGAVGDAEEGNRSAVDADHRGGLPAVFQIRGLRGGSAGVAGAQQVSRLPLSLQDVKSDTYVVGAVNDHIVP